MDYTLAKEDYYLRKEKATTAMRRRNIDLIDDQADLKILTTLYELLPQIHREPLCLNFQILEG